MVKKLVMEKVKRMVATILISYGQRGATAADVSRYYRVKNQFQTSFSASG